MSLQRDRNTAPADGVGEESATKAPSPVSQASVLEKVLARGGEAAGEFQEAVVATWSGQSGTLESGRIAGLAASCLLRPAPGDRALVWSRHADAQDKSAPCWILSILERSSDAVAVLSAETPLSIEAPRVGVAAKAVHITAQDFVSSARNRHAVEDTRTETARLRVADIGSDVRRASSAVDEVSGTMLQRTGTWISNTVREARLRARTFMFD